MEYVEIDESNKDVLLHVTHNVVAVLFNTGKINQHSIGLSKSAIQEAVADIMANPDKYDATKKPN